jgi:signal transduction histidine kinase
MDVSESVIVSSLVQGKPLHTFDHPKDVDGVILDDQVVRFMGTEGMLCMPMVAHGENVGVMVLGLSRIEYSHLTEHMRSLKMFINQAALALRVEQQRGMELRKIQSERLGASSAMARKVVHEVNNPLSIMKNYLKILGMKLSDEGIAQDEIGILNEEIDRVAHILRALTSFSEDGVGKISEVDINGLISDLVKITKEAFLKRKIELHEDLYESLPLIQTDRDSLKQIIINLVKNASEALVEGGSIYLRTNHRRVGLSSEEEGSYVEIEVSDDGPGIPDEMKRRLFEPFATSKGGGHSGLGLSIVHNLTKGLNGTIRCESEEGKGSSFKIELPVSKK